MPLEGQQPESSSSPDTSHASRLPDYHVLGSLTDVKPGTIPLLVRMPSGNYEQLDVPLHSTVDDIASTLQKDSNDVYRLSFGKSELDPGASLMDTNIVDAYEHAGSLLHLIATGGQDVDTKAAALDSACAVVETISNGIKDMEALCAAAMPDDSDQPVQLDQHDQQDHQHSTAPTPARSSSNIESDDFKSSFQNSSGTTPSQLAYNLSRRLPNLFPPHGTAAVFPQEDNEQPALGRQVSAQPSISSIREARRRASALRKDQEGNEQPKPDSRVSDMAIGESTNAPLPLNLEQPPESPHREGSLLLANSGKTTWLEDVMKTWEVDAVRESGVLEKSKDGQEISSYLQSLEADAERELEIEKIEGEKQGSGETPLSTAPGDSSDEEEVDEEHQGDTNDSTHEQNASTKYEQPKPLNGHASTKEDYAEDQLQKSIAAVSISARDSSTLPARTHLAQHVGSAAHDQNTSRRNNPERQERDTQEPHSSNEPKQESHKSSPSGLHNERTPLQHSQQDPLQAQSAQNQPKQTPPLKPKLHIPTDPRSPVHVPFLNNGTLSPNIPSMQNSPSALEDVNRKPQIRQAKRIAPAPNLVNSPLAGANGLFPTKMYPGLVPVPGVPWPAKPPTAGPKKRGRKRKNPELTDEERALARKEQNRESAKLSRVRRKVIAAEYEGRLSALIEENSMLRKQVEGLNNRLVYLQSLLTVSVRQEPPP